MKIIVKLCHYDKFANSISWVDKYKCDSWFEAKNLIESIYGDYSFTTVDEQILETVGKLRLDAWREIRIEKKEG